MPPATRKNREASGGAKRTAPRTLLKIGLILVPVGLAVAAAVGYFSFMDYVEKDPRFCSQCHQSEPELMLWMQSRHRTVVCQSCHHQSQEGALSVLMELVLKGNRPNDTPSKGHTADIKIDACASCHLSHDSRWPQIGNSIGHIVHVNRQGETCLQCHGRSIHGLEGPGEVCKECHQDRTVQMDGMGDNHCLSCHNFLTDKDDLTPSRERCLECHRARQMLSAVFPEGAAMAKLQCGACHRPHANASAIHVPCLSCHEKVKTAGLHAHPNHMACDACHSPHIWEPRQAQCIACHPKQENHNRDKRCWSCHAFVTKGVSSLPDGPLPGGLVDPPPPPPAPSAASTPPAGP